VLQRVAACCSVLQRVAACCRVLQRVAACCMTASYAVDIIRFTGPRPFSVLQRVPRVAACCSV